MPKWYRLNSSGSWTQLQSIYRLNSSGAWTKLKTIYRLNSSGSWGVVHSSADVPAATTQPTLTNQVSSSDNFYGGDTLTLTRGAYTNTTANSNTSYRMRIYKGDNASLALSNANWTVAAEATYTGANSNANTSLTYSLTDADAYADYYLVGEVRVDNDAGTPGSPTYDFETSARVLSRVSFTVSGLTASGVTQDDATLSWTIGGIGSTNYIYSQRLVVRLTNSSGSIIQDVTPLYTDRTYTFNNVFQPNTLYHATIEAIADDGWRLTASPTKLTAVAFFTTLGAAPTIVTIPSISPVNNRGYLPVSTTLTASQGTWSNVNASTSYRYDWFREDFITGSITQNPNVGNTFSYATADVGDYVNVKVTATNTDGASGFSYTDMYILDQKVAVGAISPTSVSPNQSTAFSFAISHYPTSYTINWGDGTSNETYGVAANTSTINPSVLHTYTSAGTYIITVTAQPGNVSNTASVSVATPLTPPTSVSIASVSRSTDSSVNVSLNFSGGSGPYYQMYWSGASTTPSTASYDAASTASPISDVFSVSGGTTYYFYVRSSSQNLGNTFTNGTATAGTYSNYSSLSPNPSYTFTNPTGGTASIGGNTTVGSTLTLSTSSPSASPTADSIIIIWRIANGGTGGNSFVGGTILQNGGSTLVIPSTAAGVSTVGYAIRAEVTWNNGVGSQSVNTNSIVVTAPVLAPTNATIPTLSPTTIAVGTQLSAGIGTWNNSPTSYDIRIYRGTQNVATFETQVARRTGSSTANLTYTITQADYDSGERYFRTFVDASNSGGSSGLIAGQERGPTGTAPVSPPTNTVAPSVTPSSGTTTTTFSCTTGTWTNSPTSYSYQWQYFESPFGWLSTGNTNSTWIPGGLYAGVSIRCQVTATNSGGSNSATSNTASVTSGGGGSAPATPTNVGLTGSGSVSWTASSGATSYEIEFFTAQDGSGTNAAGPYSVTGISSSPYQLVSPYASPNNWARVRVRARNSNGASAYSGWVPSATTYT